MLQMTRFKPAIPRFHFLTESFRALEPQSDNFIVDHRILRLSVGEKLGRFFIYQHLWTFAIAGSHIRN